MSEHSVDPRTLAGDPFAARGLEEGGEECFYCLGSGYHFIGSIDEDGEEVIEAYACRHCNREEK